ncbi:MAG: M48 family metalloprotease [Pirellulaceae bacterium]|jgi:STE24 endopeptidase|nr:M48 family metallopeptidase [Thermoguttaceae bacterium]MDI9446872.1 M48 family metallopeptidase [Planctomycetota bacterium]NLZ00605.1 M48 family metalloprotease [Pirellulaceae bacterium]
MHFPFLLAILATLVIADNCPSEPVPGVAWRVALAAAGGGVVVLVAWAIALAAVRQIERGRAHRQTILLEFAKRRRLHTALWIAVHLGILLGLGWSQIVRFNWNLDGALLADELLLFLPALLPLALSWVAFFQVDRAAYQARARGEDAVLGSAPALGGYLSLHARHYFGVMLLPILGLLAVQDAVAIWLPGLLVSPWSVAVYVLPIGLAIVFFPSLLRRLWRTHVLPPGPLRERLALVSGRAGFSIREILVWETGGMVVNAAVAGWLPGKRYVFLSDGLIASLTGEEIEAVFGHELGHIHHRHLALRGLVMLAPLSLFLTFEQLCPQSSIQIQQIVARFDTAAHLPWSLALLAALSSYAFFVFGGYCRLLESEADLYGCGVLELADPGDACGVFISALEKLAVASGANRRRAGWQHPSVARRSALLVRTVADPACRSRLQRRIRLLNWLLVASTLSPVVAALLP